MACAAGPDIVNDGLVLHLDAGNNDKSYPGTGTTWTDLSGNGNNGTLVNGVGYSSDDKGTLTFDGSNDYVQILNFDSDIILGQNFTVQCVIKGISAGSDSQRKVLVTNQTDATTNGWGFAINQFENGINGLFIHVNSSSFNTYDIITPLPNTNDWHIITAVFNQSNSFWGIYYDAELIKQSSVLPTITNSNSSVRIAGHLNNSRNYKGNISQTSIYNRALSESEIQQNFNALRGRYGI